MDFNILQEIREIVHGLGERKQRKDTMAAIQSVLFKQMSLIIFQAHKNAHQHSKKEISIEDVIFVLQNHKNTLKRMLKYFLFKENIHKLTAAASHIEDQEQNQNDNKGKKIKLSNNPAQQFDFMKTSTDLHFHKTTDLELFSTLAENYVSKLNDYTKKKSTYNNIRKAIIKLKLDLTTEEYFHNVIEKRQIRINELAIQLSPISYIGFELCRSRVFHNKTGELLLNKVFKALPVNVYYQHKVKEIFQYLAKETIACMIDHVYENRKQFMVVKSESLNSVDGNNSNSKKKIREAITVDEINIIITKIWNQSLDDIHIPFRENDTFLNSELIFDLFV